MFARLADATIARFRFAVGWGQPWFVQGIWREAAARGLRITPEMPPWSRMCDLIKVYDVEVTGKDPDVREFAKWLAARFPEGANLNVLAVGQGLPEVWQ